MHNQSSTTTTSLTDQSVYVDASSDDVNVNMAHHNHNISSPTMTSVMDTTQSSMTMSPLQTTSVHATNNNNLNVNNVTTWPGVMSSHGSTYTTSSYRPMKQQQQPQSQTYTLTEALRDPMMHVSSSTSPSPSERASDAVSGGKYSSVDSHLGSPPMSASSAGEMNVDSPMMRSVDGGRAGGSGVGGGVSGPWSPVVSPYVTAQSQMVGVCASSVGLGVGLGVDQQQSGSGVVYASVPPTRNANASSIRANHQPSASVASGSTSVSPNVGIELGVRTINPPHILPIPTNPLPPFFSSYILSTLN